MVGSRLGIMAARRAPDTIPGTLVWDAGVSDTVQKDSNGTTAAKGDQVCRDVHVVPRNVSAPSAVVPHGHKQDSVVRALARRLPAGGRGRAKGGASRTHTRCHVHAGQRTTEDLPEGHNMGDSVLPVLRSGRDECAILTPDVLGQHVHREQSAPLPIVPCFWLGTTMQQAAMKLYGDILMSDVDPGSAPPHASPW